MANPDAQLRDPPAGRIKTPLHTHVREWAQAWEQAECIYRGDAGDSSCTTEENLQVVQSQQTKSSAETSKMETEI